MHPFPQGDVRLTGFDLAAGTRASACSDSRPGRQP